MTPEKAFLARIFVDYCVSQKDDRRLEAALPVVTALAFVSVLVLQAIAIFGLLCVRRVQRTGVVLSLAVCTLLVRAASPSASASC